MQLNRTHHFSLRSSTAEDRDALFAIWLAAVRATHDFLTEDDIEFFSRLVRDEYLPSTEFIVAADAADQPVGFMGMTGNKIDALFVNPAWHGRGVGRSLVEYARSTAAVVVVDVNEQNRGARGFYARLGFQETGRSETDDMGKPFPLIHLASRSG